MRAVVQRVSRASVSVDGEIVSEIGCGLCVFVGVELGDGEADIDYVAKKLSTLRIFSDSDGKMNLALTDLGPEDGALLLVSQFTLLGDVRRGRRPSFAGAAAPEEAARIYKELSKRIQDQGIIVKEGVFRVMMDVELVNDGPVTILVDSRKVF